ncbi:MAG TPA: Do family serine endopeptidase [Gemmatimonadales bacterium]|nr:Do family serine endopeptidase [Gemmatimonadales bacterium]
MSARTRDWLKFGGLAALTFVLGVAFWSTLGLRKPSPTVEPLAAAQVATEQAVPPRVASPPLKTASDLGDAFVAVADHVRPAVVFIRSQKVERAQDQRLPPGFEEFFPNLRRRPQVEQGSGSGFIISSDGYILTNNHVVAGADKVTVKLYDKREFTAKVVGTDPNTDVAVIKIDTRGLPSVQFGNSDSTRVGEWALAIGNPLGEAFAFTVTAGIVSAKGRLLAGLQQSRYSIQDFIQTDAAINPGNSGGPLVNIRGQVVGINSAIASETGFYAGYGFAIPINLARTVMDQLVRTGHVERAVLGIQIVDADENDALDVGLKQITGVVVRSYADDRSPAKRAGIQLGDVIVALDGESVDNTPQLQQRVAFKKPGETVELTVLRKGGERKTISVRLARAPTDAEAEVASASAKPGKGEGSTKEEMLGISVQPLTSDDAQNARLRAVMERGGGLAVTEVAPEGPAFGRLRSAEDPGGPDIIVAVNGTPTRTRAALRDALRSVKPADVVTLQVLSRTNDSADGWSGQVVRIKAR